MTKKKTSALEPPGRWKPTVPQERCFGTRDGGTTNAHAEWRTPV
jgi:hypothetical protein